MRKKQLTEKTEVQTSTITRDEMMEDKDGWYLDFLEIARFVLIREPLLLELLGIVVPA